MNETFQSRTTSPHVNLQYFFLTGRSTCDLIQERRCTLYSRRQGHMWWYIR